MTCQTLIKSAMRKMGILASNETPPVSELEDCLEALQLMLRSWAARRLLVFASTKESFNLVSGQASYTWGTGGTITTTRPHQILGAFVRDSQNIDHLVDIISEGQYRGYSNKTATARPEVLFFHPLYPLAYIYLKPTPQDIETMWVDSMKPFTETSSFDDIASILSFPPNYEEPIIYNLAVRIAPEFGKTISAEVAAIATSGLDGLIMLNSGNQVEPISLNGMLPISMAGGYDIEQG